MAVSFATGFEPMAAMVDSLGRKKKEEEATSCGHEASCWRGVEGKEEEVRENLGFFYTQRQLVCARLQYCSSAAAHFSCSLLFLLLFSIVGQL